MVAESVVLFAKDGELTALRDEARHVERKPVAPGEHDRLLSLVHHEDDKARRAGDPAAALLAMGDGPPFLLQTRYRLHRRGWVSSKRRLAAPRVWDPAVARLVEAFAATAEAGPKLALWERAVGRVVAPLGGRKPIEETSCGCATRRADLAALLGGQAGDLSSS